MAGAGGEGDEGAAEVEVLFGEDEGDGEVLYPLLGWVILVIRGEGSVRAHTRHEAYSQRLFYLRRHRAPVVPLGHTEYWHVQCRASWDECTEHNGGRSSCTVATSQLLLDDEWCGWMLAR